MFVTKKSLSRRTMLRGMGTTLALPFLESMVPAVSALAQTSAKPPQRFGAVYFPNGAPMNFWMPKASGGDLEITPILKPLEAYRDQIIVVGNLSRAGGKTVTDHAVSSAGWLSGVVAKQTEAEDISLGVTIDQVLAAQVGQETPFPSLEFATEDFSGYVGGCVPGYSCTYMNTISRAGATAPLPMEINPRVAFERMFGRAGDARQRLARMRENRSILDSIADEARQLQRRLGPRDRTCRRARGLRRPRRDAVRSPGRGLPGRSDPRVHVHDGARGEPADVSGPQDSGDAPRRVASRQPAGEDGAPREDRHALRVALRGVHRKTADVAGWRRVGARSLVDRLWRRHERWAGPLRLSVAARGDWRCREEDARKSLPRCEGVDACRQLLAERGRNVRQPARAVRRKQRARGALMRVHSDVVRSCTTWILFACAAVYVEAATSLPLVDAVKDGNRAGVRSLLQQKTNVNAAEADGTTALHWAVRADDQELIHLLIRAGANARAANRYGVTPLQLAAINGNVTTARALLEAGADPNAALPEGETILMTAARTGQPDVIKVLLDRGANLNAREKWYGETALIWASAENHPDAVRVLLDRGADVNQTSAPLTFARRRAGQSVLSLGSWTALMYAARENALDTGRVLVAARANLDVTDPDGATALVVAIINANYEFAALLIDAGADPNVVDKEAGMGPLYAAVDMHRLAIGHGRPNPRPTGTLDSVDIVRRLLDRKADANAALKAPIFQRQHTFGDGTLGKGATPFMRAAKSGDVEMMKLH